MEFIAFHSRGDMPMSVGRNDLKSYNLRLRLGPTEKTALIVLATLKGCTPSKAVRGAIIEAAQRVTDEAQG